MNLHWFMGAIGAGLVLVVLLALFFSVVHYHHGDH